MSTNQLTSLISTTPFITSYSPKLRVQISFPEESPHTKQSFKEECDINTIMARYMSTGQLPDIAEKFPQYLDVTGIEYQTSMDFIAGAKSMFQELPSEIRNRFDNEPALFLDFVSQEKNRPELAEMGLLKPETEWAGYTPPPPPPAPPMAVKIVSDDPAK